MLFLSGNRSSAAAPAARSSGSKGGGKQDTAEIAKEWKRNLQKEMRKIDRDIANIKREEDRASKECKKLAKAGQLSAAKILAREIVSTRRTIDRMHTTKTMLNSVSMNLQATACELRPSLSPLTPC